MHSTAPSPPAAERLPDLRTSEEVAAMLNVPYRTLMRWVEEGLIRPFVAGGRQRAPRLWSGKHIREAGIIRRLREHGVSHQTVKKAAEYLMSIGHNPFSTGQFLVLANGTDIVKVCESGELLSTVRNAGQGLLFVLDLDQAAKEDGLI